MSNKHASITALLIPTVIWFFAGLFLTIEWWYPTGLNQERLLDHVINFSFIYVVWLLIFFSYQLFDIESYRSVSLFAGRLMGAMATSLVVAVIYFYFQPELIITPRRFLLSHIFISTALIFSWGLVVRYYLPKIWQKSLFGFALPQFVENELKQLIDRFKFLGFNYEGIVHSSSNLGNISTAKSIIVVPKHSQLSELQVSEVLELRRRGFDLIEFPQIYENFSRKVLLSELTDLWFLQSVNYSKQFFQDVSKRVLDIIISVVTLVVFAATFPFVAALIKLSSVGPIFFIQKRVGRNNQIFELFKYRTMTVGTADNTWTSEKDSRITQIGKWLRRLRIDEWPQAINILKGEMSLVGPRPEQVHIVEELKTQIPYYDERHITKPGLTGWAQLHVYAGSLEETKQKLQYDLYYIKHRSLLFDLEIILKTLYHLVTFGGK